MTRAEEFQQLRPLLFAIAYRILAECDRSRGRGPGDLAALPGLPGTAGIGHQAFLSATVPPRSRSTCCASARVRREKYAGSGSPNHCSPTLTRTRNGRRSWPTRCRWRPCCCSSGSARPSGRSSCCGRCSVSASVRSRRRWGARRWRAASSRCGRGATWTRDAPGSRPARREREETGGPVLSRALREGDVDGLREVLAADVQMTGDGGGKAPQSRQEHHRRGQRWPGCLPRASAGSSGVDVTRGPIRSMARRARSSATGNGKVLATGRSTYSDGQIQAIRSVIQPGQAQAPGAGGRRLGGRPRSEPGSPPRRLTGRSSAI